MKGFPSWGRYPTAEPATVLPLSWRHEPIDFAGDRQFLPYGLGRSYGDSCLNSNGVLLTTRGIRRIVSFDANTGLLRCEAGMSLAEISEFALPRGWFLPVSPGTKFVTVGGAIANDVHGKNHHGSGTWGCHVRGFELLRSNSERLWCSEQTERDLFRATIGGLGLTGIILVAEIQLKAVANALIDMESVKFRNLDEFFQISAESDGTFEYTVAWLDCVANGTEFGRGIFMRGNHATAEKARSSGVSERHRSLPLMVPIDAPNFALNNYTVRAFNWAYFNKQRERLLRTVVHYHPFFYPLDAVSGWNKIYGRRGFLQFQCVVPSENDNRAIRQILKRVVDSGRASFLAVLKEFGEKESPGLLSFPRKGVTLCLDFANEGPSTIALFRELDTMVRERGGAIYPAKDACMAPESFRQYYPQLAEYRRFIDPKFSSSFWRRVTAIGK
jgi:FAD/FMN-containing dehydrogenase